MLNLCTTFLHLPAFEWMNQWTVADDSFFKIISPEDSLNQGIRSNHQGSIRGPPLQANGGEKLGGPSEESLRAEVGGAGFSPECSLRHGVLALKSKMPTGDPFRS
jgi:hypothetical protein